MTHPIPSSSAGPVGDESLVGAVGCVRTACVGCGATGAWLGCGVGAVVGGGVNTKLEAGDEALQGAPTDGSQQYCVVQRQVPLQPTGDNVIVPAQ